MSIRSLWQELEHRKEYYSKQLEKMKAFISTDKAFSTYVDYYEHKLEEVEKEQSAIIVKEIETNHDKATDDTKVNTNETLTANPALSNNTSNAKNDDPFDSLDLGLMGYTTANSANTNRNMQRAIPSQQITDDTWEYMCGGQSKQHTKNTQRKQTNISLQRQQLRVYIRQDALKYMNPPPDAKDEAYPHWYQRLLQVENMIYTNYMKRQHSATSTRQRTYIQSQYNPTSAQYHHHIQPHQTYSQPSSHTTSYTHHPQHQSPPNIHHTSMYHQQCRAPNTNRTQAQ
eukprot:489463_1